MTSTASTGQFLHTVVCLGRVWCCGDFGILTPKTRFLAGSADKPRVVTVSTERAICTASTASTAARTGLHVGLAHREAPFKLILRLCFQFIVLARFLACSPASPKFRIEAKHQPTTCSIKCS